MQDRVAAAAGDAGLERAGRRHRRMPTCSTSPRRCWAAAPLRAWTSAWCTPTASPTASATFNNSQELGGLFVLQAMVKADVDPAVVERALDEELARLIAEGPTAAELARAKTVFRAGFVRGIERIGGFGGKADILAAVLHLHRRSRLLSRVAGPDRGGDAGRGPGRAASAGSRRATTPSPCCPSASTPTVASERRPQQGPAGGGVLPGRELPDARARHAVQRRARGAGAAARSAGGQRAIAVRRRLRRRPGRQARHRRLHPGDARRGRGQVHARWISRRAPRTSARRSMPARCSMRRTSAYRRWPTSCRPRWTCWPTCCCGRASTPARSSACARPGWPASRRRRPSRVDRAAPAAAAALRRRPRLRHSLLGQRHRGLDRRAHARRPGRLPPALAAAGQRHRAGGRRHHAGRDRAAARRSACAAGRRPPRRCRPSAWPRSRCRRSRWCTWSTSPAPSSRS